LDIIIRTVYNQQLPQMKAHESTIYTVRVE